MNLDRDRSRLSTHQPHKAKRGSRPLILRSNNAGSGFGAQIAKIFGFVPFIMERKMQLGIQEFAATSP
jgi:hypothetical protein